MSRMTMIYIWDRIFERNEAKKFDMISLKTVQDEPKNGTHLLNGNKRGENLSEFLNPIWNSFYHGYISKVVVLYVTSLFTFEKCT